MAAIRTKSRIYEEIIELVQECSRLEGLEVEKVQVLSEEVALLKIKLAELEAFKERNKELVDKVASTFDNIDRLRELVNK